MLLPPAPVVLLPVVPSPPLLLLDGELDDAVCVAVPPPLLDGELDDAVCIVVPPPLLEADGAVEAVGPESAIGATAIVVLEVGTPGSMVPILLTWLQVNSIAAKAPLVLAPHWFPSLNQSICVPHNVSAYATSWTLPLVHKTGWWETDPRPGVTMHWDMGTEAVAFSVLGVLH